MHTKRREIGKMEGKKFVHNILYNLFFIINLESREYLIFLSI